jgi:hypothetical protein
MAAGRQWSFPARFIWAVAIGGTLAEVCSLSGVAAVAVGGTAAALLLAGGARPKRRPAASAKGQDEALRAYLGEQEGSRK